MIDTGWLPWLSSRETVCIIAYVRVGMRYPVSFWWRTSAWTQDEGMGPQLCNLLAFCTFLARNMLVYVEDELNGFLILPDFLRYMS